PAGSPSSFPHGFYRPLRQVDPSFLTFLVRPTAGAPEALTSDLRRVVREIDPNLPLYDVRTAEQAVWESSWFYSVFGTVFVAFGLAALFMASVGLYGVLSFSVSRRTQEMGIRMALGAAGRDVRALILRQGAVQVSWAS
ncbi:MAG: FtsX-like permease family protein, partial [Longimicrobiales bacterium]